MPACCATSLYLAVLLVSTSSMQSEYQGIYGGMQELVWIRGMLAELGLRLLKPTPFFLDSQSAEDLAMNPVCHKRSKHIEIKYHWVREHVDPEGEYKTAHLVHVRTGDQSADIFTKALTGTVFVRIGSLNLVKRQRHLWQSHETTQEGDVDRCVGWFFPLRVFPT